MNYVIFLSLVVFPILSYSHNKKKVPIIAKILPSDISNKILVLNFGSFHFGYTPVAVNFQFDEHK